jgi:nitroreductase
MTTLTEPQLLSALNWRYATKKFDAAKKIPAATWAALEQALVLAPSSYGLQPWKFIVVDDPAVRQQLLPASRGQTQIVDAARMVVFTFHTDLGEADVTRFLQRTAEVRGATAESLAGYKSIIVQNLAGAKARGTLDVWQSRQVYIALGQFMAAAAMLGVDTCPMEGIVPAQYDAILGLTGTRFTTLCACTAGYRAADDKYAAAPKVRFPTAEVISHV